MGTKGLCFPSVLVCVVRKKEMCVAWLGGKWGAGLRRLIIGDGTCWPIRLYFLQCHESNNAACFHTVALLGIPWLSSEKAMAPHSSMVAWKIPGTAEPGGLPSMGSHRVGHN